MANGFGEAFGSAYARSLQMTREEYEKEREKDRRQALLLQLVGAPVAAGITKGVAGLIQEPFKEATLNFFNTEKGRQFQLEQRRQAAEKKNFQTYEDTLKKSGLTEKMFHGQRIIEAAKLEAAPRFREMFGEDYQKQSSWSGYMSDLENDVYKTGGLADIEVKQAEAARKNILSAKSKAQQDRAYKKYNPFSSNPVQAGVRWAGRKLRRESFDEYKDRRIRQASLAAGFTGVDASGEDVNLNERFVTSLKTGYGLENQEIIRTAKELLNKRFNVTMVDGKPSYEGLTDNAKNDLLRRQVRLEELENFNRAVDQYDSLLPWAQQVVDKARQATPADLIKDGRIPSSLLREQQRESIGKVAADLNAAEYKKKEQIRSLKTDTFNYEEERSRFAAERVREVEDKSYFGSLPSGLGAQASPLNVAEKEFDEASDAAFEIAIVRTQAEVFNMSKLTDSSKYSAFQRALAGAETDAEGRSIFLNEVTRTHQFIMENNLYTKFLPEGQEGRTDEGLEKGRTILYFKYGPEVGEINKKMSDGYTSTVPKTDPKTIPEKFVFLPSRQKNHAKLLETKSWQAVLNDYKAGKNVVEQRDKLLQLERQFVDKNDKDYLYDQDSFDYSGFPEWEALKAGEPYNPKPANVQASSFNPRLPFRRQGLTAQKVNVPIEDLLSGKQEAVLTAKEKQMDRLSGSASPDQKFVASSRGRNKPSRVSSGFLPQSLMSRPASDPVVDSSISPEEMDEIDSALAGEEKRLSDLVPVMANRLVKSNSFLSSNRSIEENLDFELEDMFKRNPDLNSLQRDAFTAAVELAKRILKERLSV